MAYRLYIDLHRTLGTSGDFACPKQGLRRPTENVHALVRRSMR
ncbi:MAG TPA: hypothetical protein VF066_14635 [Thermoleophilaceae bacterium]